MYTYETIIGYSQCTPEEKLKIPDMVNLLQNCTMFHSASLGLDLSYYKSIGKAWLLSSWQIEIEDLPKANEVVAISTKSHTIKGFFAGRNFWLERKDGTVPIKANTVWFYVNVETGKPERVPQSEIDSYGCEDKLDMEYEAKRMAVPSDMQICDEDIIVTEAMLDTNMHVNNGQYVRLAYELVQKHGQKLGIPGTVLENAGFYPKVTQICAEYRNAAKYGNVMRPMVASSDEYVWIDLRDEAGKSYATIRFKF